MPSVVVSFRAPAEMAAQLAELGADTENSRANVVYLLLSAALNGCADTTIRILRERNS